MGTDKVNTISNGSPKKKKKKRKAKKAPVEATRQELLQGSYVGEEREGIRFVVPCCRPQAMPLSNLLAMHGLKTQPAN